MEGAQHMSAFGLDALSAGIAVNAMYDLLKWVAFGLFNKIAGTAEERAITEAYRYAYDQESSTSIRSFLEDRERCSADCWRTLSRGQYRHRTNCENSVSASCLDLMCPVTSTNRWTGS
jgi:hypothetical protein